MLMVSDHSRPEVLKLQEAKLRISFCADSVHVGMNVQISDLISTQSLLYEYLQNSLSG